MAKGLIQDATWRSSTLIVMESALILGAVATAVYVQLGSVAGLAGAGGLLPKAFVIVLVCQLCLYWGDLYDDPQSGGSYVELMIRTLQALGATCLMLAAIYALFPDLVIGRGVLTIVALLTTSSLIGWRVTFGWVSRHVGPRERLLMVGASSAGLALARELHENEE